MDEQVQDSSTQPQVLSPRRRDRINALLRLSPGALPGSMSWPVAGAGNYTTSGVNFRRVTVGCRWLRR